MPETPSNDATDATDATDTTEAPGTNTAPMPASPRAPKPSASATRDLLANERTLLAWARTAVAIMGLGFVVARFGLLLRELAGGSVSHPLPRGISTAFGVALVVCGTLLLVLAHLQYRSIANDILHGRIRWDARMGLLLTGLLVLAGLVLALYLLLTG